MDNQVNQNEWDTILKDKEMKQNLYEKEEPSKSKKVYKLGFILLVLLFIGSFCWYYVSELNSKKVVISSFLKLRDNISFIYEPVMNIPRLGNNFNIAGNLKLNLDTNLLVGYEDLVEKFNDLNIDYNVSNSSDSSLFFLDILVKNSSDNSLKLKFYQKNKERYLFLEEIYDKYLRLDDDTTKDNAKNNSSNKSRESLTIEDFDYIFNIIKTSVSKNLGEEYFYKKVIFEDNTPLIEATLKISGNEINEIVNLVVDDIKKDDKASEIMIAIDENFFDNYPLKTDEAYDEDYTFVVVTSIFSNTLKSMNIKMNEYDDNKIILNEFKYEITKGKQEFSFLTDGVENGKIEIEKDKDNNFEASIYSLDYSQLMNCDNETNCADVKNDLKKIASWSGNKTSEGYLYKYTTMSEDESNILSFSVNNNSYDYNYSLSEEYKWDEYYLNLKVDLSGSIKNDVNLNEDISDYKLSSELTDEEINEITNKLFFKIQELFMVSNEA